MKPVTSQTISPLRSFITSAIIIVVFEALILFMCNAQARSEPPQFITLLFIFHVVIGELAISAIFLRRYGFNLAIPARGLKFMAVLIVTLLVVFATFYTYLTSYQHILFSLVKSTGVSTTAQVDNIHYYHYTKLYDGPSIHGFSSRVEEVSDITQASRVTMTLHYNGFTSQVGYWLYDDSDLYAIDFTTLDQEIRMTHQLLIRYTPFLPWITEPEAAFSK